VRRFLAMSSSRLTFAVSLALGGLCYSLIAQRVLPSAMLLWQLSLAVSVIGLIAVGADWLVDAACRIAQALGVSHLVIGLTIVAFGTSAPEVAASLVAGFQGNGDITVANVVGSNIFNLCFILGGVAALVRGGLQTDRALVARDAPILLVGTALLFVFLGQLPGIDMDGEGSFLPRPLNLRLEAFEGLILLACLATYLTVLYRSRRGISALSEAEQRASVEAFGAARRSDPLLMLLGLACVIGGCHVLVGHAEEVEGQLLGHGALWFARLWDVPDYVVGVTIIAAGTSAPEFVVSLVAAARGAHGLSAGNLIGSDIFNMFGVVGLAGILLQEPMAPPVTLSAAVVPSLAALSAVVLLTLMMMRSGFRVTRIEGVVLVLIGCARWVMDFAYRGQF